MKADTNLVHVGTDLLLWHCLYSGATKIFREIGFGILNKQLL